VGPSGSEREREEKNRGTWDCPGKREAGWAHKFFDSFKKISNEFELFWSKGEHTMLQKFQINYVFEGKQIRNKFPYRNFSKFGVEFELKPKESLRLEVH
jgi:hypothetical protein